MALRVLVLMNMGRMKSLFGRRSSSNLLLIVISLLTVSCSFLKSPQRRVDENRNEVEQEFQKELKAQLQNAPQGELKLTWNQALEKMYMHNPTLLKADFRVEDVVDQQRRLFTDLVPLLSFGASDSFTIENFDQALEDVNFRVYSYLPLGQIFQLPKQVYTKKLMYMAAQLHAEQAMRQEVIALYRLFQKQYLLELEGKALSLEGGIANGLIGLDDPDAIKMRDDYVNAHEEWAQRKEEWRVEVGDFLMSDYARIHLKRAGLPNITYKPSDLNFTDTGRWGMLQLNLLAMEKISRDARILDTYMRYFPSPSFNVSAPPLYSDSSDGGFDVNDIRLGQSLNWSLDTRGSISQQLNRIKREQPLEDWRNDKRRREEIKKLLDGKEALIEIQGELVKIQSVLKGYRKAVKSGLVGDPQVAVRTMRNLREKQVRLAAKEIEICTSFWLIDESRWTATTQRWQETRKVRAKLRKEARKAAKKR